jgi:hypothetical protein
MQNFFYRLVSAKKTHFTSHMEMYIIVCEKEVCYGYKLSD